MMMWSPTSPDEPTPARLLARRYRVGAPLAAGSAGTVFAGRDERTCQDVILKFFDGDSDPFRPWLDEARSALRLRHAHVIACHNLGFDDETGLHFLVMERAFGGSLRRALVERAAFTAAEVGEVLADVGRGLAYAHGLGVVHRDVKPENIVARSVEGRAPWMITDFGSSRFVAGGGRARSVVGSAQYIAPEIMERDATAACDQFSLGVTALELWLGATPTALRRAQFALTPDAAEAAPAARVRAVITALAQPDRARRLPCMDAVAELLATEQAFATSALRDGTVLACVGDVVLLGDGDQRGLARRLEVPQTQRLLSHRGSPRAVIAARRRLVALAARAPVATLYASDRSFEAVAVCERRGRVALRRCAGELEIVGLADGEILEVVALPSALHGATLRGAFLPDARLALLVDGGAEVLLRGGGAHGLLSLPSPVREVVALDDEVALLCGDAASSQVDYLGSGRRQAFAVAADRVVVAAGGARVLPEPIELLALEAR